MIGRHKLDVQTTINRRRSSARKKSVKVVASGRCSRQIQALNLNWKKLCVMASGEVEATLAALPKPLRARAEKLPVTFERQPNADLQADGIEPDTLGLFTGPEFADEGTCRCRRRLFCFWKTFGILPGAARKFFARKCGRLFCTNWGIIWDWTRTKLPGAGWNSSNRLCLCGKQTSKIHKEFSCDFCGRW